jgi:RNA polymerase sigma factor (sigma-70 family)
MPRNTSVTDTRLMRRSQQGDRRAFRALLSSYDWRLRGLAHALLLDPARVDAVLRVAYVRAWREVVRIDPREDAAAWLYRVVYNACIDGLRRESTRIGAAPPTGAGVADTADSADSTEAAGVAEAADAVDAAAADAEDAAEAVDAGDVADAVDAAEAVDAGDVADAVDAAADPPVQPMATGGNGRAPAATSARQARLVEALAGLAPADRIAVVLVDREGFAPEAAARILGLTPEVVEARLSGARARLTHQLADVVAAAPAPIEEAEPQPDAAETQADETEAQPEEPRAPSDEPQAPSEEPTIEVDDATSADPADTKVASPSAAGRSPNGSSGAASTNGSDEGGGGAS